MLTLSVVSTAYNGEDYIVAFLESIAAQMYRDFEFIIVDDASTDRTTDLIEAYLPRLGGPTTFIRHEKNLGQHMGNLRAFSKASGNILINVDSDSVIPKDTFAKIMESFSADEQTGMVTTLLVATDRSNWILRGAEVALVAQHRTDLKDANNYAQVFGPCFALRRCLFQPEEFITVRSEADWAWRVRKRGWKIVLREDIAVQTRLPSTLPWTFVRGRRMAGEVLPSYWHNKEKFLTRWGFWVKFAPLGLTLTALFKPRWALAGLLGWLVATQLFLARKASDYSLADRLAAWGVTVVRWTGFNVEVVLIAAQAIFNQFKSDEHLQ